MHCSTDLLSTPRSVVPDRRDADRVGCARYSLIGKQPPVDNLHIPSGLLKPRLDELAFLRPSSSRHIERQHEVGALLSAPDIEVDAPERQCNVHRVGHV